MIAAIALLGLIANVGYEHRREEESQESDAHAAVQEWLDRQPHGENAYMRYWYYRPEDHLKPGEVVYYGNQNQDEVSGVHKQGKAVIWIDDFCSTADGQGGTDIGYCMKKAVEYRKAELSAYQPVIFKIHCDYCHWIVTK